MAEGPASVKSIVALLFSCKGLDYPVFIRFTKSFIQISGGKNVATFASGGAKGAILLKEIEVKVIDNDIEKAMRILKKKIQNDGLFKRLKLKKSYEKPSEHRRRKQREAQRRERIAAARAARRR
jgi:small subunit ribosomal protein S21